MYWHDGGTGGFRSYAAFDPAKDFGVVVLLNSATELADPLGQHIVQRLTGQPAVSLVRP
jgi:CubicO group peptidase (beta-lactamase class C family)